MLRKYNRIFILLNGKNEGVGINLNGSCDIEVINGAGKLYAYIGGIGKLKPKKRSLYLISAGIMGTTAVSAGEFELKGSNAVLEASFDPDNVFGSGITVDSINTAAVWHSGESPEKAVLEGFVSQKTSWLKNLEIYGERKPEEKQVEKPVEPADEAAINDLKKEMYQAVDDNTAIQAAEAVAPLDFSPHNTFMAIAEKFRRELDMLDDLGVVDKSAILNRASEKKEQPGQIEQRKQKEQIEEKEEIAQKPISILVETVEEPDVSKNRKPMTALDRLFLKNDRLISQGAIEWVKIDYREAYLLKGALNELRTLFVKNSARRARHMIAGRESGKYYIGIPGSEEQRETAEGAGFSSFLKIGTEIGYWVKAVE
ncbi:hypothetical protein IMSAG049_00905 [Clostridiales bacterium]|nr:hypothetical protein IMSAG049_00905 [Clostridiales bacterium]